MLEARLFFTVLWFTVCIETYHLKTNFFRSIYIGRLNVRAIFNNLNTLYTRVLTES